MPAIYLPAAVERGSRGPDALTSYQHLFSGGLAGALARSLTSPLDVVKILFQIQTNPIKAGGGARFNGFLDAFPTIYREEGLRAFWKGNGVACLRLFPYSAIKFAFYERIKEIDRNSEGSALRHLLHLAGGGLAGVTASLTVYPLDLIKTRLTVQHVPGRAGTAVAYNGVADAFAKIVRDEGVRGLYKGVVPSTLGFFIYEGFTFFWYEAIKLYMPGFREQERSNPVLHLISGSLAGALAQTVSYPLDVVRKRMHASSNHPGMLGGGRYTGMMDCIRQTIAKEGFFGLYKGTTANLAKVTPFAAIQFAGYEQLKKLFTEQNRRERLEREAREGPAAGAKASASR
eukprot:tig00021493_g21875.t1